jgi:hypothetical protein
MNKQSISSNRYAGMIFIFIPFLIQIPYTLLIVNFQYPDILRMPTDHIFSEFQKGGSALIWTWWFFGFSGLPLVYAYLQLFELTRRESPIAALSSVLLGISALFFQLIGLMRWVFVVPILAKLYSDPNATLASKEALVISFQTIHHLFGVILGEHLGQLFTIFWMMIASVIIIQAKTFPRWVGIFGLFSSFLYLLAQTELFALVMPEIHEVPMAGLLGSLSWLLWMVIVGLQMIKKKT